MNRFKDLRVIGEGSFGIVYLAQENASGTLVAIKRMKRRYNSWEECMNLREVRSLRKIRHPNIIKLREVFREENQLHLVFDYAESNLFKFYSAEFKQKGNQIPEEFIKRVIFQTLRGLEHLHAKGFFHRDLKPENLLVDSDKNIKIADFGLAREIRSMPPYTDYISTRWYRAPEILLKMPNYSHPVDIFALGCIMAELFLGRPMFDGKSEMDQLHKIFRVLGHPKKWTEGLSLAAKLGFQLEDQPGRSLKLLLSRASPEAISLLENMFQLDPSKRGSATSLMQHPFFRELSGSMSSSPQKEISQKRGSLEAKSSMESSNPGKTLGKDSHHLKHRQPEKNDISKINPDLYSQLMSFKLKQRAPASIPEEKSQKSEDDSFYMHNSPHDEDFLKQSLMENKSLTEEIDTIINRKSQPILSINTRPGKFCYSKNKTLNAIGENRVQLPNPFGSGVESYKKFRFANDAFAPVNPLYNSKPFNPSCNNLLSKNTGSKKCFLENQKMCLKKASRMKPSQSFSRKPIQLSSCEPSFLRPNPTSSYTPKSGINIDIPQAMRLNNINFQKLTPSHSQPISQIGNFNGQAKPKTKTKNLPSGVVRSPKEFHKSDKARSPDNKENLQGFQTQTSSKDLLPSYMMFLGPKHDQSEFKFHF